MHRFLDLIDKDLSALFDYRAQYLRVAPYEIIDGLAGHAEGAGDGGLIAVMLAQSRAHFIERKLFLFNLLGQFVSPPISGRFRTRALVVISSLPEGPSTVVAIVPACLLQSPLLKGE